MNHLLSNKFLTSLLGLLLILGTSSCYISYNGDIEISTPYTKDASLATLSVSSGTLAPAFSKDVTQYNLGLGITSSKLALTAIPTSKGAVVSIENNSEPVLDANNIYMNLGQNTISVKVTSLDGTTQQSYYVIANRSMTSQEAYIKASNAEKTDEFGTLALYGNTMVVAAGQESSCVNTNEANNSCKSSGIAYVFTRDINGGWYQEAELKASNSVAGLNFGWQSVDIYEDTIVVSANYESSSYRGIINEPGRPIAGDPAANTNSYRSGAAYVFVRDQNTGEWYQQAYIKGSNSNTGDYFGYDVKLYKDTLAVSAPQEDSIAVDSGAIYIFQRANGIWSQEAFLKASNAGGPNTVTGSSAGDNLGRWTLAIYGNTVVAGSYYEDSNFVGIENRPGHPTIAESNDLAVNTGAVYVFTKTNGEWKQTAFLKGSNLETTGPDTESPTEWGTGDHFYRVDLYKDTLVVGTSGDDSNLKGPYNTRAFPSASQSNNSSVNSGAAYVFERTPGTNNWSQKAYIKASNAGAGDGFGCAVKIYEDTIAVAARYENNDLRGVFNGTDFETNNNLTKSGALYVFAKDKDGKWVQSNYLKASNAMANDSLAKGSSNNLAIYDGIIAVSTNYEANNFQGIINEAGLPTVGASNVSAPSSGAVYVFK